MGELTRGERLQIMLTDDELVALDDWRAPNECQAEPQRCVNY